LASQFNSANQNPKVASRSRFDLDEAMIIHMIGIRK